MYNRTRHTRKMRVETGKWTRPVKQATANCLLPTNDERRQRRIYHSNSQRNKDGMRTTCIECSLPNRYN